MKQLFKTLGIEIDESITITELLGENFNPNLYQMADMQKEKVNALRDICLSYLSAEDRKKRERIDGPKDAANQMKKLRAISHEEVWVVLLDRANRVISKEHLFTGTLSSCPLSQRDIIAKALSKDASGVILYHNHPSGLPRPSQSDIEQTRIIRKACSLMEIQLLDHIIIGSDSYYSFTDELTCKF